MPLILKLMCLGALASACTTVLVNTTSGVGVIGRTMELGSMDLAPRGRGAERPARFY